MQTTPTNIAEAKVVKSTTDFIKNRIGNSVHINEIELKALVELMGSSY